jgi:hypothetical protein
MAYVEIGDPALNLAAHWAGLAGLAPAPCGSLPADAPEQGNSDAAEKSTERRRREILKGGMPTRREVLKILKDAGV